MHPTAAEQSCIGAVMLDTAAYWRIADIVGDDDFSEELELWQVVSRLAREGKRCDAITVGDARPELQSHAMQICGATPSIVNVRAWAEIVARNATMRRLHNAGQRIAKLGGEDALGEAQRILQACAPRNFAAVRHVREFVRDSFHGIQARYEATSPYSGLCSGITELDELTAGFQAGDLIILAARPSVGKTALAVQIALHAAEAKNPALMFSLEMGGSQLTDRCIAHIGRIDFQHLRLPKLMAEEEWPRLTASVTRLREASFHIDETAGITVEAIGARARQVNSLERLSLIVIDYLQFITPPRAENTTEAIQVITRQLKQLAKELKVPILLLSQLSRDGDERPTMKHLRGSGAIEQDADVVMFLHRPQKNRRDLVLLDVAKQRNGPAGEVYLHADMPHMRFDVTDERPDEKADAPKGGFQARYGKAA